MFSASILPGVIEPSSLPIFKVSSSSPVMVPILLPSTRVTVAFIGLAGSVFTVFILSPLKFLFSPTLPTLIIVPAVRSGSYFKTSSLSKFLSDEILRLVSFTPWINMEWLSVLFNIPFKEIS